MEPAMGDRNIHTFRILAVIGLVAFISGCAAPGPTDEKDPFEGFNRSMYDFNDMLDRNVLKPVAQGYNYVLPNPVNKSISNAFNNIDDVVVIFNDIMQLKPTQTGSDIGRFLINSTVGIGGLFDVAKEVDLVKHEEDFGQSMGYWGIGNGPYLVLPLLGPMTVRDGIGSGVDAFADPLNYIEPDAALYSVQLLEVVDKRAGLLSATKILKEAALDPYLFVRDAYLQKRRNLVYDGNPPPEDFEEL